jgi:hypothetical protein
MYQMPKKFFLYPFRSLVTFCWINEIDSNPVPFIAVFNLGSKKKRSLGADSGE